MMPARVQWFLKLNPVYYIIQGYRDSLISGTPFWYHTSYTLYFWSIALSFFLGSNFFKATQPPIF